MTPVTLERAREVKQQLRTAWADLAELRGIGIAVLPGGFGVKVNLSREVVLRIPDDAADVPIVVDVVGSIRPL